MIDPDQHFHLAPKRNAEFFTPENQLKKKVGTGGLSENILNKAQALLEDNTIDFRPLGEMYLESIMKGILSVEENGKTSNKEDAFASILFPTVQLKANGGMFHYPLITRIADRLIQFLEVLEDLDTEALEIIKAFHTTIRAILLGQIKGDGGQRGDDLLKALVEACYRYFEKFPDRKRE
ncbi:MAG: hypothetical protein AAB276_06165 [Pseudomonadota bacterium]